MPSAQSTNWCWTAFDPNLNGIWLTSLPSTYWCYGVETCPDTKKEHWQGYIEFEKRMRLSSIKKLAPPGIHWEVRQGSQEQAIDYCKKDGDFHEAGTKKEQGKRSDLLEIQARLDSGDSIADIADDHFMRYCQYGKRFEAYKQLRSEPRTWVTEVHFIHGPTGTGKTRFCMEKGAAMVEFDKSGFCHGYENQEILLFDDFDVSTITRSTFLRLTDRYATTVNVKGGTKNWNPRCIYITSNFSCEGWYSACPAVARRITSVTYMPAVRPAAEAKAADAMLQLAAAPALERSQAMAVDTPPVNADGMFLDPEPWECQGFGNNPAKGVPHPNLYVLGE